MFHFFVLIFSSATRLCGTDFVLQKQISTLSSFSKYKWRKGDICKNQGKVTEMRTAQTCTERNINREQNGKEGMNIYHEHKDVNKM